jgi:hypothetical protein
MGISRLIPPVLTAKSIEEKTQVQLAMFPDKIDPLVAFKGR